MNDVVSREWLKREVLDSHGEGKNLLPRRPAARADTDVFILLHTTNHHHHHAPLLALL